MRLVIDIGNSQTHYGVMDEACTLLHEARVDTNNTALFAAELEQLHLNFGIISIAISSVAPSIDEKIRAMCEQIFKITPFFLSIETCKNISFAKYSNPSEIGADILASLIYAVNHHPNTNLIIVDLGTANTIVALNKHSEFLGGIIMPGVKAQYKALISSAEQLDDITLTKPNCFIGDTTEKAINSGIVNGIAGSLQFTISCSAQEQFAGEEYTVIATGGASALFRDYKIFDHIVTDLVLQGIYASQAKLDC